MSKRPTTAMQVSNLAESLDFLTHRLGFKLVEHQADIAQLLDPDGDLFLLAGPAVEDVTLYLDKPHFIFKPGETLSFAENNLDARKAALMEKGLPDVAIEVTTSGERKLSVQGPDGYIFAFVTAGQRSPEEILALYERGGRDLEALLAGLSEADFDLARAPGQWSIRQIVHHVAEGESMFMAPIKSALAQSGSTFVRSALDQDVWPVVLGFASRPVGSSVTLIKAIRENLFQLIQYVPDSWEHDVIMKPLGGEDDGRRLDVGSLVGIMVRHMSEHYDEIKAIRQVHGR